MRGRWEDRGWGLQFSFRECQSVRPKGVNGVKRYLAQHIKWIGPAIAEEIIRRFGEGFFDIVESDHRRSPRVEGSPLSAPTRFTRAGRKRKRTRRPGCSSNLRISPAMQNRIQAAFSKMPIAQLIETQGQYLPASRGVELIGFITADKIARRLDFDMASPFRIRRGHLPCIARSRRKRRSLLFTGAGLVKAAATCCASHRRWSLTN
jgi:exodeoxyribonuclease V alpha subunit